MGALAVEKLDVHEFVASLLFLEGEDAFDSVLAGGQDCRSSRLSIFHEVELRVVNA